MTLWPFDLADEADRRTRAGDVQGVVTLLDGVVEFCGIRRKVWQCWMWTFMKGVMRALSVGMPHGFPECLEVFRALMQYASPEGDMFALNRLGPQDECFFWLVWGRPSPSGTFIPDWPWMAECSPALQPFAEAWVAENARWSTPRAAWVVAAVVSE